MSVHRRWFSLPREPATVATGRRRVRDLLTAWGTPLDEDTRFALDLITSELLGNAVRHASGPAVTVGVHADPLHRRAVVEVYDSSPALPVTGPPASDDAESGRGLLLVTELALAHGVVRKRGGKWVWAEIALPGRTADGDAPDGEARHRGRAGRRTEGRAKGWAAALGRFAPWAMARP
ncbi:ATP-binding protein [Kitasatospora sp. NPDC088134]|uniref:ATP-binding protein n=1 Tax=Kitasatospora sp. NPDC088134 TaxID=3364071 RepID=UPI0038119011